MKCLTFLALSSLAAVLSPPAQAQDGEAEKLFRAMEQKLLGAKAFEVRFEYQLEKRKVKGEMLVTQENKVRLKVVGIFEDKPKAGFELVADGKKLKTKGARLFVASNGQSGMEEGGESEWQTPKTFHKVLGTTVSRGGVWFTMLLLPYLKGGEELEPDQLKMRVYDFKLIGDARVGAKNAKVVRYRFGKGGPCPGDEEITIWIDAKTELPLKRSFTLKNGNLRIVENYREFRLDPKIDAKAFELPK
jgi:outer membrane lipoprotein-sorting protein